MTHHDLKVASLSHGFARWVTLVLVLSNISPMVEKVGMPLPDNFQGGWSSGVIKELV